jgi:hypothetical protein
MPSLVVTQLPVALVKAMLALLRRVRAGGQHRRPAAAAHASTAKIVIMEHPATDYKPSNPK